MNASLDHLIVGPSSGPALILIPGLGSRYVMYPNSLVQGLVKQGYRVILVNNRDSTPKSGSDLAGLSSECSVTPAPYDLVDMAQDIVELANRLKLRTYSVLGTSMGGLIAQILAGSLDQERIERVVLAMTCLNEASSAALGQALNLNWGIYAQVFLMPKIQAALGFSASEILFNLYKILDQNQTDQSEIRQRVSLEVMLGLYPAGTRRQLEAICKTGSIRHYAQRIQAPCLIVQAQEDPLIDPFQSHQLASCVPGAQVKSIKDMGHFISSAHGVELARLISLAFDSEAVAQARL